MNFSNNSLLAVCIKNSTDLKYVTKALNIYFGKELEIVPVALETLKKADIKPRAVVTSYLTTVSALNKFPNSEIIQTKRALTGNAFEEVIQLPKGSKALVVNSLRQTAIESKNALLDLGIDHIQAEAYWPGSPVDVKNYNVVIYSGIMDYCPQGNFQYINIGHRCIAISTIIEIIKIFGLSSECATRYHHENIKRLTNSCYSLSEALNHTKQIKESFENICDLNTSIMFAINNKGDITVFNRSAVKFFDFSQEDVIGENYKDALKEFPVLIKEISSGEKLIGTLISIKEQKLLVSTYNFFIDGYDNRLINILPVAELQEIESKARMKLHSKGFLAKNTFEDIVGKSESTGKMKNMAKIYADTNNTVLITGESGTGKEFFAQAIHNASSRSMHSFVGINFAALPETLVESELFGYEEGAFTGAIKGGKEGLFEIAHKGTIFLDEIGDASLEVQAKLLRVLEEHEIVRVGSTKVTPIDARVICATNRNLQEMMKNGTFRTDLFYRIKVLNLHLKPLRERKNDILHILNEMIKRKGHKDIIQLDENIQNHLKSYDWPGNIRELRATADYIFMLEELRENGKYNSKDIKVMLKLYLESNLEYQNSENHLYHSVSEQKIDIQLHQSSYISNDLLLILSAIKELEQQSLIAGRGSLSKLPKLQNIGLSETKVKTRLKKLEKMGLVSIGTTKQGVHLTQDGNNIIKVNAF